MWLAKQQKRETAEAAGTVGEVTLGGDAPAVEMDSERRGLAVYAPGGYRWRPALGESVLVLKTDGEPCVIGSASAGDIAPGEVELDSSAGASVKLDNEGRVVLGQDAWVTGRLYVQGVELKQMIRSIAEQVAAEKMGE